VLKLITPRDLKIAIKNPMIRNSMFLRGILHRLMKNGQIPTKDELIMIVKLSKST